MAEPLLQAQLDINAPAEKVWGLISDFGRMPQWTRPINLNRRNFMFRPTTSTVTEVVAEKWLAFRVNPNNTMWSYQLEPTANGTRLVETRNAES